jgi:catechol 2,3-dioxygenase-like lactoylglutathione lyase family enzyme
MNPHVSAITLGVSDVARAKQFYGDGLGWPILEDYGNWVSFRMGDGSSSLGLLSRDALADDAGQAPNGGGGVDGGAFAGVVFSYLVRSDERVDEVMAEAERAGATVVKPAKAAPWGGASGHFADPDGYLWKVASGSGDQPFGE